MRAAFPVTLLLALAVIAFAAPWSAGAASLHAQDEEHHEEGMLGTAMLEINRTMRGFRNIMRNGQFDKGVEESCKLQRLFLDAKAEMPHVIEEIADADERQSELISYRKQMHEVLRNLFDLETAFLEKDGKKAGGIMRKLGQLKEQGHQRFQGDEEEGH